MTSSADRDRELDGLNRKIKILYLVIVVYAVVTLSIAGNAIEGTRTNCVRGKAAAIKSGQALDYFANSNAASKLLTPAQLAERTRQLNNFKAYVAKSCPGIWPLQ